MSELGFNIPLTVRSYGDGALTSVDLVKRKLFHAKIYDFWLGWYDLRKPANAKNWLPQTEFWHLAETLIENPKNTEVLKTDEFFFYY